MEYEPQNFNYCNGMKRNSLKMNLFLTNNPSFERLSIDIQE